MTCRPAHATREHVTSRAADTFFSDHVQAARPPGQPKLDAKKTSYKQVGTPACNYMHAIACKARRHEDVIQAGRHAARRVAAVAAAAAVAVVVVVSSRLLPHFADWKVH